MLEVSGLRVSYGKIVALRGVDVRVGRGESVSVVGRNGAGKTTLLKSIIGLVRPAGGKIVFGGTDVTSLSSWDRARMGIGYVPEGRRVFPYLTVEENLRVAGYSLDSSTLRDRLEYVYQLFPRLRERRGQLAYTLSGGEAQMLSIARGLVMKPSLLLMDEPSQGLAPKVVEELFQTIGRLKEEGYSLLLVEQNVVKALEVSERVYVLDQGRVVYEAPASEAVGDPVFQKTYLGGESLAGR